MLPSLLAHLIPARQISLSIPGDILRRRLKRKMRRGEGEKFEERAVGIILGMVLQPLDRVIGDDGRGVVVILSRIDRRQGLVIFGVVSRRKMAVMIVEAVGVIEAARQRF